MAEAASAPAGTAQTAVSRRLLLGLYAVVPLALGASLVDGLLLDGAGRAMLPPTPDQLPLWTLVFNVPHVVASSLLLADGEYLRHYRVAIAGSLLAVGALTLVHALADLSTTLWIAAAILNYHLIGQQVGIARLVGGCRNAWVEPWKWLGASVLLLAGASQHPNLTLWPGLSLDELHLGALLCLPLGYAGLRVWLGSSPGQGRLYVLGNQVMFLSFVPLTAAGYPIAALVMIRVVHDLTAFTFYIVHDRNRHRHGTRNALYRVLAVTHLPHWSMLIGTAVGVGYLLTHIDTGKLMHPVAMVSMFHYCTEAVTWRRAGLHRRAVSLA